MSNSDIMPASFFKANSNAGISVSLTALLTGKASLLRPKEGETMEGIWNSEGEVGEGADERIAVADMMTS